MYCIHKTQLRRSIETNLFLETTTNERVKDDDESNMECERGKACQRNFHVEMKLDVK